ncbi:hypothetical protein [Haladaptatus sp. NG-SE-30]
MSSTIAPQQTAAATQWLRGFWQYYREYTHTAAHAASAAALTAFGLLIFINRLFALLAIASYIVPPIILYRLDADLGKQSPSPPTTTGDSEPAPTAASDLATDSDSDDGDSDSDSDGDDGDSDTDGDDGDTDSDGRDGDTDTDS